MPGIIESGEDFISDISDSFILGKVILNLRTECFLSWALDLKAILSKGDR